MTAQGRCSYRPPRWGRLPLLMPPDVADATWDPTGRVASMLMWLPGTGVLEMSPTLYRLEGCLVQDSAVGAARGSAARPCASWCYKTLSIFAQSMQLARSCKFCDAGFDVRCCPL